MRYRSESEAIRRDVQRAAEVGRGESRGVLRMTASRHAGIHIADFEKLPVSATALSLRDDDGNYFFMVGFSKVGGPDVMR